MPLDAELPNHNDRDVARDDEDKRLKGYPDIFTILIKDVVQRKWVKIDMLR